MRSSKKKGVPSFRKLAVIFHENNTVFPQLARILWQPKNRASRNSCYASQNVTFYSGCTRGIEDILKLHF